MAARAAAFDEPALEELRAKVGANGNAELKELLDDAATATDTRTALGLTPVDYQKLRRQLGCGLTPRRPARLL